MRIRHVAALAAAGAMLHAQAQPRFATSETIDVIGTTPLGAELPLDRIAAHVQAASAAEIRERGALDLADFMRRGFASVFVNEAQNNPLQPDLQYRGFVGSPLLGLPQGLAVYQHGVRLNEPFGDTVNWALLPESAIESVYVMPGSNPLFGLNALGGAIAIETKSGFSSPGTRGEILAGSFGRRQLQAETGGTLDKLGYFATVSRLEEDGWRDHSPTEATQLYATLGTGPGDRTFDVSLSYASTDLVGNGATPIDLLEIDRRAIFTRPDQTRNEAVLLTAAATRRLSDALTIAGNAYVRDSDVATYNGDDSDLEECEETPGFLCEEDDEGEALALDANGAPIPEDESLEGATINRTRTKQRSAGFNFQSSWTTEIAGRANRFAVGLSYERSDIDFGASTELGTLDATRLAVPGGVWLGESFTSLATDVKTTGLYLSNSLDLGSRSTLTLSGRYNRVHVQLEDRLGTALDGEHRFERFNPAVGYTLAIGKGLGFYAGYSQSNRSPTPVELTCADEDDPCRLPNAFLADPPLEQVVAATMEAGLRGRLEQLRWHAGVFRTTADDDILFISAGAFTNEGYFDNVGKTRREGLELTIDGNLGERLSWFWSYTRLRATVRETFAVPSEHHPAATTGEIAVEVGDRLPLVPKMLLKAGVRFAASDKLSIGADIFASGKQHLRGDEGNLLAPLDGYALLNVRAQYRLGRATTLFFSVDNLLDEEYETFGLFGEADEVLGEDFEDPRFLGPGAPRAAWVGVRFAL